jgi:hypothetical protein
MTWRKLGHVYAPDGSKPWMRTHAANPFAEHLAGDRFRIYFSARDDRNRSCIAFVDIDLKDPSEVLLEADAPVLGPGAPGMFDDSGCSIGCIVPVAGRRFLYYMGWHVTDHALWQNAVGLAVSEGPGQPFRRISDFPVVELNAVDPYTISYPWVRYERGGFRMWYGSSTETAARLEDIRHPIKYAESDDGVRWSRSGAIALDVDSPGEFAICRPCVVRDGGLFRMWFCSRGDAYRIHDAESPDGMTWLRRHDSAGIDVSPEGWDSDMIEYPHVFDHGGERYMLYAGNGYGRTGFGLAVLDRAFHIV